MNDTIRADMPSGKNPRFNSVPSGAILFWGAATAPQGWLLCDGSSVLRAAYPDLFAAIGTTFGSADSTHFTLPDLRGRVPVGTGTGSGLTARTLAATGGAETVTLSTAEMPAHQHGSGHFFVGQDAPLGSAQNAAGSVLNVNQQISSEGGGGAHANMQPFLVLTGIIKT